MTEHAIKSRAWGGATPFMWLLTLLATVFVALLVTFALKASDQLERVVKVMLPFSEQYATKTVTDGYLAGDTFNTDKVLCVNGGPALCGLLVAQSFDRKGTHDHLWMMLDAGATLVTLPKTPEEAELLNLLYFKLGLALASYGVMDKSLDTNFVDKLYVNDLYKAILAHAMACRAQANDGACSKGVPAKLADALQQLAEFILIAGDDINVHEMVPAKESVRLVARTL